MAFGQYPNNISAIIQTGPDSPGGDQFIPLGKLTTDANEQLQVYRLQVIKRGLQPLVQMRVRAYRNGDLIGESEVVRVSDIENQYSATDTFYGWIVFTFNPRINLSSGIDVYFFIYLFNYAFVDDTKYIAAVQDWPITMGYNSTPGAPNAAPVALELYGAR